MFAYRRGYSENYMNGWKHGVELTILDEVIAMLENGKDALAKFVDLRRKLEVEIRARGVDPDEGRGNSPAKGQ
ncbi:MAG: hypothetical protein C0485_00230 [Pirellula sp.]|nr:hypothetical protein [Pirellula sp.]